MENTSAETNQFERVLSPDVAVAVTDVSTVTLPLAQQRRRIHRVPPPVRRRNGNRRDYDPSIVSLGPYHHGVLELHAAEEVKHRFLDRLTSGSDTVKASLRDTILEQIGEYRACYADEECLKKYEDAELATMMLLDACFTVALMEGIAGESDVFSIWHQCLGVATMRFAFPDLMLLENQLPFAVLKMIVTLRRGDEGSKMINSFLNWFLSGNFKPHLLPESDVGGEPEPLHLLEACHRMITGGAASKIGTQFAVSGPKLSNQDRDMTSRSVMDLKSKGIEVRPTSSCSIRDIKFKSNSFPAELRLPTRMVWSQALSTLSNVIAYEMSPGAVTAFEVLSYTNFMKSLTESVEDAKELQAKGVLINRFQNQQQLVDEFRGLETFGIDNFDIFRKVKMEMEDHCNNRARTWLADLIHTRFASPSTVIAWLAAVLLLCLTFLQTYFTIQYSK